MTYYDDEFYDDDEFWEVGMTATELLEVLRGDHGPEAQAQALDSAGIELADDEYDEYEADENWAREFVAQQIRLEQKLGRELTGKEIDALAKDHHLSDQPPNLMESFERVTGRSADNWSRDKDQRQAIATEAYQEAEALKQAEAQIAADGAEADSPAVGAMADAMGGHE